MLFADKITTGKILCEIYHALREIGETYMHEVNKTNERHCEKV